MQQQAATSAEVSDSGRGRSRSSGRKVTYGFHMVEGKQGHAMEDYVVAQFREVDGHELGLFAVFDGHLGHEAASYLRANLFENILKEVDFWTDTETAIRRAYRSTNTEIIEGQEKVDAGSTAVTAILIDGTALAVANVGDSRAVLSEGGTARQLSVDHDPDKERGSIESRGGFVTSAIGNVPRVDGQLATARAFGDRSLQEHITSDPDVFVEKVGPGVDTILLASDGVWKVMSNQEAVDVIRSVGDPKDAARRLVREAVGRRSTDDISCIVVKLH